MTQKGNASLRVVLDTNVYLSIFVFPEKKTFNVWRLAKERRYTVVLSPFIVNEFMEKLREKFGTPEERREAIKKDVAHVAHIVQPKEVRAVIAEDQDDDHILTCAVEGNADVIVSGDKHLLRLKEYEGIAIVRPLDFLRMFEK